MRWLVRVQAPLVPTKGRAITRDTLCGCARIERADWQARYSSPSIAISSCAAIWKTESADV